MATGEVLEVITDYCPARQTIPNLMRELGYEACIVLIGEGAYLAKKEVARSVHGVGFPPLPELIDKVVEGGVPVYV